MEPSCPQVRCARHNNHPFEMRAISVTLGETPALAGCRSWRRRVRASGVVRPRRGRKTTLLRVAAGAQRPDSGPGPLGRPGVPRPSSPRTYAGSASPAPQVLAPFEQDTVLDAVMAGADHRPRSPVHQGQFGMPSSHRQSRMVMDRASHDLLRELDLARYAAHAAQSLPMRSASASRWQGRSSSAGSAAPSSSPTGCPTVRPPSWPG